MKLSELLSKLQNWVKELNTDAPIPTTQLAAGHAFTSIVALIVTGLVTSVLATYITQEMLSYSFPVELVIGMVVVLLLATALQVRGLPFKLQPIQLIAFLLTLVAVQSTIIAYMYISHQPSTIYLVFDATEAASDDFPELLEKTVFAAQVQDPQSLGGLRIYGGQQSGQVNCSDTKQLIVPVEAKDFKQELFDAFDKFDPKGNASLTIAVLKALTDDLEMYRGPIKLVVVASGVDPKCDLPGGELFEEIAADIRENTTKEITIAIIGVGNLTQEEEMTLDKYARAFGGIYCSSSEIADLSALILAPPSYFGESNEGKDPCSQP